MPNAFILHISIAVLGGCWLVLEIADLFTKTSSIAHRILVGGAVILALEGFFMIQWLPFRVHLHLLTLTLLVVGFLMESLRSRKT